MMLRSKTLTSILFLTPFTLFFYILNVVNFDWKNSDEVYLEKDRELLHFINNEKFKLLVTNDSNLSEFVSLINNSSILKNETYNSYKIEDEKLPTVFVITPTYLRSTQMPDLTRLAQTLMLVKDVFWIVSEDSNEYNKQVRDLLDRSKIPYVHLLGPRPPTHLDKRSGRGVSNRLKALEWLRNKYTHTNKQGVLYFADDDNSYDIRLFDEIRSTQKVSVFPVGLLANIGISSPIIKNGKVVGFHDPWNGNRIFIVDMAGFAVNLQFFLKNPKATMPYKVGYEEDFFIRSLNVTIDDLEPKAKNCTEVYVWHTKTELRPFPSYNNLNKKSYSNTNLQSLYKNILETKVT